MIIRKAKGTDVPSIILLLHQLWPKKELEDDKLSTMIRKELGGKTFFYLVAFNEKKVLGFLRFHFYSDFECQKKIAYIDELVVDKKLRGKGIGSALLKECERLASRKTDVIALDSEKHRKRAHDFYKKHGYKITDYYFRKKI
jgi:ribosomal protein S18 acetylase RimI-like enzyme